MSNKTSLKRKVQEIFINPSKNDKLMMNTVTCKRKMEENMSCTTDSDCEENFCQIMNTQLDLICPRCLTYMPYLLSLQQDRVKNRNQDNTRMLFSTRPPPFDYGTPDECLYGSVIANRLKKLADDQRIYAEKIINDALHYGMLNRLSSTSNVSL